MKLKITRCKNKSSGTIGKFELCEANEKPLLSGYTREPAGEDCVTPGRDLRVPQGVYEPAWEYRPRFGRVLAALFNEKVSKNRRIRIHAGNYPKDTLGCVLLGAKADEKGMYDSKKTLEAFM
ncbi:DUF5675 family protein, partial [Campylobacter concisus]|uniref:DUF5675 family protein n=1 Tax=Campylobacter concisus TaxID=199 RepID=UPI000CD8856D